jgi:hypothetical protein
VRAWAVTLVVLTLAAAVGPAPAQDANRQELARELARLMLDEPARRRLDEQVSAAIVQAVGGRLQDRLSRPLLELEWGILANIVTRFVGEALPPNRMEEITAQVYARHFDDAELSDLVRFQRSALGRKAARLTPVIGSETVQAIDAEIRDRVGMPGLLDALQRAFPVLRLQEAP